MAGKIVCIRVDEEEWKKFKKNAQKLGFSRNELLKLFISSINRGETQIQKQPNITNVNINLVPITNTNLNIAYQQTKVMKNQLILDEIKKRVTLAEKMVSEGREIPYMCKEGLKKLVNQALFIPPDLFERVRQIVLT